MCGMCTRVCGYTQMSAGVLLCAAGVHEDAGVRNVCMNKCLCGRCVLVFMWV